MDETIELRTKGYRSKIEKSKCLEGSDLQSAKIVSKHAGKVRDVYVVDDKVLLISTDRQSAFDRAIAHVPCKGQVLTKTSVWWFNATSHIIPNHMVDHPDPAVMVCKPCRVFPIEFVVRGYITGSTNTSMWTHYAKGVRNFCGNVLQDGWKKHQKLPGIMVTPTTKDTKHDELIDPERIIAENHMSKEDWEFCSSKAIELFKYGQQIALSRGLLLVDTKYEFGRDEKTGEILLIDEIHTPDSSRYWIASSYEERMKNGEAPEHIDKEFLRLWFKEHCDPYKDTILPQAPMDLIFELARRYIMLYEMITGETFEFNTDGSDPQERLQQNLKSYI